MVKEEIPTAELAHSEADGAKTAGGLSRTAGITEATGTSHGRTRPTAAESGDCSVAPKLEFSEVSQIYEGVRGTTTALDSLSLQVHSGESVAILGPSGCGNLPVSFWHVVF